MSIKNIAVIGIGELGSRHLQSLYRASFDLNLFAVDPSEDALILGRNRVSELEHNHKLNKLNFVKTIQDLPNYLDLVVIATNSDVRIDVIRLLLEEKEVKYLILEKVLFQKIRDYQLCSKLLKSAQTEAWVNCPRRIWKDYFAIKDFLSKKSKINYVLTGGIWGLGCNAIHFLDHFSWLTGSSLLKIDSSQLDKQILRSKREGFIEFTGKLEATYQNGNNLSLASIRSEKDLGIFIRIEGEDFSISIDEGKRVYTLELENQKKGSRKTTHQMYIPFQSELTSALAESLFKKEEIGLTPFEESSEIHKLLINSLIPHIESVNDEKVDICAIT